MAKPGKSKTSKSIFSPELKHPVRSLWDLKALHRITGILWSEKVDLVHTHSSKAGILGRWAAKKAGVPRIVHTVHGWGFYPGQFFLTRWLYQTLERWAARFTDVIITVSEENRQAGLAAGMGKKINTGSFTAASNPRNIPWARPRYGKSESF